MRISSWRNGGPNLDRGDAAPGTGVFALYAQYNVGGSGCDDFAVVQVVPDSGESDDLAEVERFCKRHDNCRQGAFSFQRADRFEAGAALFPDKNDD